MNIPRSLLRLWQLTSTIRLATAQNYSTTLPTVAPGLAVAGMPRAPVISISHGGGPMPVLGDPKHAEIVRSLRTRVPQILKLGTPDAPRAIAVVTAHWQTGVPSVSAAAKHKLYYDYGNFPAEAYKLTYDAPGEPEVAAELKALVEAEGFEAVADTKRGAFPPGCL